MHGVNKRNVRYIREHKRKFCCCLNTAMWSLYHTLGSLAPSAHLQGEDTDHRLVVADAVCHVAGV